jgi:stage II sporulation protein Q
MIIGLFVSNNKMYNSNDIVEGIDYDYTYDILNTPSIQVNNTKDIVIRPYNDSNVKIVKGFYDYKGKSNEQQNSLIYYNDTYIQNTGICYSGDKEFDILAIYDGEVTEVTNDELIGNSITIKHNDNTYSIYQSIKNINVKKGDYISQGQKIATSGVSNIDKELNNHLYFELVINDLSVNPEEYYDNTL